MSQSAVRSFLYLLFALWATCLTAQDGAGWLQGRVIDDQRNPVEFANVFARQAGVGVMTDSTGFFRIQLPALDSMQVTISHASFEMRSFQIYLTPAETQTIEVTLRIRELADFVVEDYQMRTSPMEKIEIKSAKQLPMVRPGIEGLLTGAVGVVLRNEMSSAYSVRGGSYEENLIYVNDIEVYRPFLVRVGQQEGLSFPNVDMIGSVSFSAGGFEARYGDKLASVLDIKYKKPTEVSGSASASLLGGSVHFEGASENRRFTHITGVRYMTNQYVLGSLDEEGDYRPWFVDAQTYLTYDISERFQVGFLGSYGQNNYNFVPQTRRTELGTLAETLRFTVFFEGEEQTRHETAFGALAFDYKVGKNSLIKLTGSFFSTVENEHFDILGRYRLEEIERDFGNDQFNEAARSRGVGGFLRHARNDLEAYVTSVSLKGFHEFPKHYFQWGVDYRHEQIFDRIDEWEMIDSAGFSVPHPPDSVGYVNPAVQPNHQIMLPYVLKSELTMQSNRLMAYVQDSWSRTLGNGAIFTANAGLRANYWDFNNQLIFSPRANFSYKPKWEKEINDTTVLVRDVVIKFATGLYQQPPFYRELRDFEGRLNPAIRAQRSIHFVLGTDINFRMMDRPFKFVGEMYYKHLLDIIPYEVDNVRLRYYAENNATGYATGLDLKINGEFIKGIESWASISFMRTREDIKDDFFYRRYNAAGDEIFSGFTADQVAVDSVRFEPGFIPRPTDQLINFNLFFQDEMPNWPQFKVHLSFLYGTGLPFGPPTQERYRDTLRTTSYRRVDIGFSYDLLMGIKSLRNSRFFGKLNTAWVSLEIFNLFGANNVVNYLWIRDDSNRSYAIPNFLTGRRVNLKFVVRF
ncbi:MAG: TonB-dependent receptor [Cryomorphaceae bacterium]|nr:MAG: TonB-dependent receptor [Cryomorphaceae bacterium]